jgi:acyl carrier protein
LSERTVTLQEITQLVGVQLGKRNAQANDRLLQDLGAESADVANIVTAVEDKYGIEIQETEIASIQTSSDLYELVAKHLGKD